MQGDLFILFKLVTINYMFDTFYVTGTAYILKRQIIFEHGESRHVKI